MLCGESGAINRLVFFFSFRTGVLTSVFCKLLALPPFDESIAAIVQWFHNIVRSWVDNHIADVIRASIFFVRYPYFVSDGCRVVPVGMRSVLTNVMNNKRVHGLEKNERVFGLECKPTVVARVTRCKRGDEDGDFIELERPADLVQVGLVHAMVSGRIVVR